MAMKNTLAPLLVTLAIQVMTALSMMAVPVLASNAAPDIGVSAAYVGLFVALIYLGAMISSVAGGALVPRFGAIRVSQICLLLCAVGLALAMLGLPAIMTVAALIIGCGYGPITPASSHVLAKSTRPTSPVWSFRSSRPGYRSAACWPVYWCRRWCFWPAGAQLWPAFLLSVSSSRHLHKQCGHRSIATANRGVVST